MKEIKKMGTLAKMYFLHVSYNTVMRVHWNYASLIRAKAVVLEHPSGACWGLAGTAWV